MLAAFDLRASERVKAEVVTAKRKSAYVEVPPGGVAEGSRNQYLFNCARGWRDKGFTKQEAMARLHKTNDSTCIPPLSGHEVCKIVDSVFKQPARGFVMLPHFILDDPACKRLPLASKHLLTIAIRRAGASSNGKFSLPENEFKDVPGLKDPKAVRRARKALVKAGWLTEEKRVIGGKGNRRNLNLYFLPHLRRNP